MHRDIKSSNLLIDKRGVLKIADFGLANSFALKNKGPLTNRVVTLWYRSPELLLGSTDYGFAIDLWSAGCLLAEMFVGRPIMPGRTEVNVLVGLILASSSKAFSKFCNVPFTPLNYNFVTLCSLNFELQHFTPQLFFLKKL